MKKTLSYVSLLFFIAGPYTGWSQEALSGLEVNPQVRHLHQQSRAIKSSKTGLMELPFFDDFSRSDVYPDPDRWTDRYAFINNDYAENPVSLGVATLDALDHTGAIYEHASTWPFVADYLTSVPLNLNYPDQDSIYLSFFYQPQGKGDQPQPQDSLRLEFYSPVSESWKVVWSAQGDSLHEFMLVMVPINSPDYLQEGFRFRFSNLASLADNRFNPGAIGNADHWNIDYVYIDRNRSYSDTIFRDIAFTEPVRSLLNNYEAMPWNQFVAGRLTEMGSLIPVTYRNNDIVARSVRRQFSIFNEYEGRISHSFSGGIVNIDPGELQEFSADLAYTFSAADADSVLFSIKAWLVTDDFDFKGNDTVVYHQRFRNYFALDDGTAENGYGLFGGGAENASLACRFRAYAPDSLRAINIYFNQSLNDASRQYFRLAVWDDDNGRPGNLVYTQEGVRPNYEEGLNRFHTYHLDSAVYISQVFYVGLIQTTSEFLNIGWDVNRNSRNRIFYNIHGEWVNTSFEGSLMIRPVTGNPLAGAKQIGSPPAKSIKAYPNPAINVLYIELEPETDPGKVTYRLYNRLGQLVFQSGADVHGIDLSGFPPGIYFLRAESSYYSFETKKILVTK